LALALAAGVLLFGSLLGGAAGRLIAAERSFFGVYRITASEDGAYRLLRHGTTVHGAQALDPRATDQPLTYYHRQGPLGQIFAALDGRLREARIGAVGLGAGAVACYGRSGQRLTFFEIDPLVAELAADPAYFTLLASCGEIRPGLVLGDARLTLAREPDGAFDLLILDAFSSDSIPLHLLTREAMQLYLRKLAAGGVIAFHISNRYLDLAPVLSAVLRDLGGAGRISAPPDPAGKAARLRRMHYDATWVAIARDEADLGALAMAPAWRPVPEPSDGPWTDDFSNILDALRWPAAR
jgi:hypothetical protein